MPAVSLIVPLNRSVRGRQFIVHALPHGHLRILFLRLGISEGDQAVCAEKLPGGTVVIRKNRQRIAVGGALARQILVRVGERAAA